MTHQPTAEELATGTRVTLADMKMLDSSSEVALIGGQAVIHYIERFRTTKDIDIMTTSKGAPDVVKKQLLERHKDRYRKESDQFEVKVGDHWIQVDMVPADMFGPGGPKISHLKPIKDIGSDMPWAGVADLIVAKMFSAPIRPNPAKRTTDIQDIVALAKFGHNRKESYTTEQRAWVKKEIDEDKGGVFKDAKAELKLMFNF